MTASKQIATSTCHTPNWQLPQVETKTKQSQPTKLQARKIESLVSEHGSMVRTFLEQGRLPLGEIGDFYGRHPDRRTKILAAMEDGMSYWKGFKESRGCFDTKRWGKIANRSAACRGLLLKTTAELVALGGPTTWSQNEREQAAEIASELACFAKTLAQQIVCYEAVPKLESQRNGKRTSDDREAELPIPKLSNLKTARTKLKKNTHDVPQMLAKLGAPPTVDDVAHTIIEAARIKIGAPILLAALQMTGPLNRSQNAKGDFHGIGFEYAAWLNGLKPTLAGTVKLATHKSPDADALVSTWIVERFLFPDVTCQVEFVPRNFDPRSNDLYDAVLDVGRTWDKDRLIFDHKPPAFSHRDDQCATSLVWQHAQSLGCKVDHLRKLVELVHDGDAATRRQRSKAYTQSRVNGLHAMVNIARRRTQNDQMLYQSVASYLDACFLKY